MLEPLTGIVLNIAILIVCLQRLQHKSRIPNV